MADVAASATPIVALDVANTSEALSIVDGLGGLCRFYKIGSELFTAEGPAVVRAVQDRGASVFLDLKFHDIPNTVRGAVRSAAALGARLLTVHAAGGRAMLEAAAQGASDEGASCDILAVSVLTSLDASALSDVWGREVPSVEGEVVRLGSLAVASGLAGVVCSGHEARAIRSAFGDRLATLVPGIRLPGGDRQDQARVVTPAAAVAAGARYLVIGRAVTAAKSPPEAMKAVLALGQIEWDLKGDSHPRK